LQPSIVFFSSVLFLQQRFISLATMAWRKLVSFHGSFLISPVFAILSDDHHLQVVASSYSDHGSNVLALERSSSFGDLDQYSVECVLGRGRRRLSAESLQTAADVQHAPEEVSLEYIYPFGYVVFLSATNFHFHGSKIFTAEPTGWCIPSFLFLAINVELFLHKKLAHSLIRLAGQLQTLVGNDASRMLETN
jgi:hypothetical protein